MSDCERVRNRYDRHEARCCSSCHDRDELSTVRAKGVAEPLRLCCTTLGVVLDLRHSDRFDIDPEDPPSFMMRAARAL